MTSYQCGVCGTQAAAPVRFCGACGHKFEDDEPGLALAAPAVAAGVSPDRGGPPVSQTLNEPRRGARRTRLIAGVAVAVIALGVAAGGVLYLTAGPANNLATATRSECEDRGQAVFTYLTTGNDGGDSTLGVKFREGVGSADANARVVANDAISSCDKLLDDGAAFDSRRIISCQGVKGTFLPRTAKNNVASCKSALAGSGVDSHRYCDQAATVYSYPVGEATIPANLLRVGGCWIA